MFQPPVPSLPVPFTNRPPPLTLPQSSSLCTPLEIKLEFKTTTAITDANQIRLDMPGFTRGTCQNTVGSNLLDQTLAKRAPAALWNVKWYEGTVANSFSDSYFLFNPVQGTAGVSGGDVVTIVVDKALEIKANCGTTSTQAFRLVDEALGTTNIAAANRTQFTGGCYFTDTRVDVEQPLEKTWMKITLKFRPAMPIAAGENVTFNMAGFTTSNFTGKVRLDEERRTGGWSEAKQSESSTLPTTITNNLLLVASPITDLQLRH